MTTCVGVSVLRGGIRVHSKRKAASRARPQAFLNDHHEFGHVWEWQRILIEVAQLMLLRMVGSLVECASVIPAETVYKQAQGHGFDGKA